MLRIGLLFRIASVLIVSIIFSGQAFCDELLNFQRKTPIVEVYEKTHKSVVNISGTRLVSTSYSSGFGFPDLFDSMWGPRLKQEVSVLGSGAVVHEDGYVMTNAHVVEAADNVKIIFSNGDEFPAAIIASDKDKDLALLKIQANKKLPFIHLGRSDDLMIGETVIAIGNPYGYANTLTSGILSATNRDIRVSEGTWLRGLIQTDAPINPGNSGGPLFNINGELIGINTAIAEGAENIGFAIPVDIVADNIRQMIMPEKLRRVRLGLDVGRVKTSGAYSGLTVNSVAESSPAAEKGIKTGDIILEVDGHELSNIFDFYIRMMSKDIGEPIKIKYARREGNSAKTDTVTLTLLERPLPDGRKLAQKFFQMDVSNLDNKAAQKFGFDSAYPVLIINDTDNSGMADNVGLKPGDLILGINEATVHNMEELSTEMEKISSGDVVALTIMRIGMSPYGQVQRRYAVKLKAQDK
ncbi:MAG: trypsin-like peptidase domain-containing protein [Sedimentisphaerales bacterium]|nr:trypsin-like peptidase domain-containing protein [Sedimentisphaerales bacterium]